VLFRRFAVGWENAAIGIGLNDFVSQMIDHGQLPSAHLSARSAPFGRARNFE
jgi:hypothetical protein